MIKCYLCGKEIPDEITEYEETRITITSKWCDDCRRRENIRLGFSKEIEK